MFMQIFFDEGDITAERIRGKGTRRNIEVIMEKVTERYDAKEEAITRRTNA